MNPRALGTNPRALATNPRARRGANWAPIESAEDLERLLAERAELLPRLKRDGERLKAIQAALKERMADEEELLVGDWRLWWVERARQAYTVAAQTIRWVAVKREL